MGLILHHLDELLIFSLILCLQGQRSLLKPDDLLLCVQNHALAIPLQARGAGQDVQNRTHGLEAEKHVLKSRIALLGDKFKAKLVVVLQELADQFKYRRPCLFQGVRKAVPIAVNWFVAVCHRIDTDKGCSTGRSGSFILTVCDKLAVPLIVWMSRYATHSHTEYTSANTAQTA